MTTIKTDESGRYEEATMKEHEDEYERLAKLTIVFSLCRC